MIAKRPLLALVCVAVSIAALAAWGPGDNSCAADSKPIKIDFETRTLGLLLGEERTVHSTVTPERCRNAIRLSVQSGALPPGMHLASDGHISGTPTTEGTYRFKLAIGSVRGHPIRPEVEVPASGEVTLIIAAFFPDDED
jgi:hypothetical protein